MIHFVIRAGLLGSKTFHLANYLPPQRHFMHHLTVDVRHVWFWCQEIFS